MHLLGEPPRSTHTLFLQQYCRCLHGYLPFPFGISRSSPLELELLLLPALLLPGDSTALLLLLLPLLLLGGAIPIPPPVGCGELLLLPPPPSELFAFESRS